MARLNFVTHNVELWFWTIVINTFGSKPGDDGVQKNASTGWSFSKENIVKAILACTSGFLIGFVIGVVFL